MEIQKVNVDPWDCEELACKILGVDYEAEDYESNDIEQKLADEWGISTDEFQDIISRLLPLIEVGHSPLTGRTYLGFVDKAEKRWICKTPLK